MRVYLGEARSSINRLNDVHFVWESFQHSTQIKHFQKFCWAYVTGCYCGSSKWPFIFFKKVCIYNGKMCLDKHKVLCWLWLKTDCWSNPTWTQNRPIFYLFFSFNSLARLWVYRHGTEKMETCTSSHEQAEFSTTLWHSHWPVRSQFSSMHLQRNKCSHLKTSDVVLECCWTHLNACL